jgi:hypothetical protein
MQGGPKFGLESGVCWRDKLESFELQIEGLYPWVFGLEKNSGRQWAAVHPKTARETPKPASEGGSTCSN